MKETYGLPYQGSKNATAGDIVRMLPKGKRLVDLFGGGASVTHAGALSNKYERILYNDIDSVITGHIMTLKNGELSPLRFVDKTEFNRLYEVDPMVFFVWKYPSYKSEYAFNKHVALLYRTALEAAAEKDVSDRYREALADPLKWAVKTLTDAGVYNYTPTEIKHADDAVSTALDVLRDHLNKSRKEHGASVADCCRTWCTTASHFFQKSQQHVPSQQALERLYDEGLIGEPSEFSNDIQDVRKAVQRRTEMLEAVQAYTADFTEIVRLVKLKGYYNRVKKFSDDLSAFGDALSVTCSPWTSYEPQDGDVIYMDPPYESKWGYGCGITYEELSDWIRNHDDLPIYVSEMKNAEWTKRAGLSVIWTKKYVSHLKDRYGRTTTRTEALWTNETGRRMSNRNCVQLYLPGL